MDSSTFFAAEWLNTKHPLSLEHFRGRVLAVEVFQMLCPGCVLTGLPQAQRLAQGFEERDVAMPGPVGVPAWISKQEVSGAGAIGPSRPGDAEDAARPRSMGGPRLVSQTTQTARRCPANRIRFPKPRPLQRGDREGKSEQDGPVLHAEIAPALNSA